MATTRCYRCGKVKFNAYFYTRKDRRAVHQPCRKCCKELSAERYRKIRSKVEEVNNVG